MWSNEIGRGRGKKGPCSLYGLLSSLLLLSYSNNHFLFFYRYRKLLLFNGLYYSSGYIYGCFQCPEDCVDQGLRPSLLLSLPRDGCVGQMY